MRLKQTRHALPNPRSIRTPLSDVRSASVTYHSNSPTLLAGVSYRLLTHSCYFLQILHAPFTTPPLRSQKSLQPSSFFANPREGNLGQMKHLMPEDPWDVSASVSRRHAARIKDQRRCLSLVDTTLAPRRQARPNKPLSLCDRSSNMSKSTPFVMNRGRFKRRRDPITPAEAEPRYRLA